MKLKTLASGSKGNCHLLIDESGKTLILDCGIPIKEIKRGLRWDIGSAVGAIVTHHHKDHSRSAADLERIGIPVFKPYDGMKSMDFKENSDFRVQAFDLTTIDGRWTHTDADGEPCPCYGFLITHKEMGRMLYITDTGLVKWRFRDINHILLGANYDKELISADNQAKKSHIFSGHMELETVCDFICANNQDGLRDVILCHLSAENADEDRFIARIKTICPAAHADIAKANREWRLCL